MTTAPDPSFDALLPPDMASKVVQVGVTKASLPLRRLVPLGVLAGAFIGLGANFSTVITADTAISPGIARLLGGLVFSLGLVLVVVSGAELRAKPGINTDEQRRILFGQTASVVR